MTSAVADPAVSSRPGWLEVGAYRVLGWKLGRRYPEWVHADVTSGRADRRRLLVCGLMVPATQLLAFAAVGFRAGGDYWPYVAVGVVAGVPLGLLLGRWLIRRQGPAARQAKLLRYQGLLPSGDPDPTPKGMARLTNLDIAAIQLLSVAFLGLTVGVVPHLMFPEIRGRCVDPDGRLLAALDAVVPTGVDVRAVAAVHQRQSTVVSAALADGRVASWLRAEAGPVDQLLPLNMAAFAIAGPAPLQSGGTATFYGTGDLPVAKAEACAAKRAGLPAASRSPTG